MQNKLLLGGIGVITGIVNGLLGIGGGTILIPAMIFLLGEKQHKAHGTSLAIILPTALISAIIYKYNNYLDLSLSLKVALGAVVGGYIGAKLMNKIPAQSLKKLFGIFMVIAGLRMVF
ncbi:MAG: sulfite exporter TauE/SafE family protein [Peptococcaceae bacterium]